MVKHNIYVVRSCSYPENWVFNINNIIPEEPEWHKIGIMEILFALYKSLVVMIKQQNFQISSLDYLQEAMTL